MRKTIGAICGCIVMSAGVLAATVPNGYELKRQPKVGAEARYQVNANFQYGGRTAAMNMEQTESVTKVETDGSFEVKTAATHCKFTVDGKEQNLPDSQGTLADYDRLGVLLTLRETDADGDAYRKANMLAFIAPEKAVQVGDKWDREFKPDSTTGLRNAKTTFEVEKLERIDGQQTAEVKFDFAESEGNDPISSSGHMWVATADGSLMKIEASFKNFPMGANGNPVDGTFSMARE